MNLLELIDVYQETLRLHGRDDARSRLEDMGVHKIIIQAIEQSFSDDGTKLCFESQLLKDEEVNELYQAKLSEEVWF